MLPTARSARYALGPRRARFHEAHLDPRLRSGLARASWRRPPSRSPRPRGSTRMAAPSASGSTADGADAARLRREDRPDRRRDARPQHHHLDRSRRGARVAHRHLRSGRAEQIPPGPREVDGPLRAARLDRRQLHRARRPQPRHLRADRRALSVADAVPPPDPRLFPHPRYLLRRHQDRLDLSRSKPSTWRAAASTTKRPSCCAPASTTSSRWTSTPRGACSP